MTGMCPVWRMEIVSVQRERYGSATGSEIAQPAQYLPK
ncbi:hypothetical protein BN931_1284 [Bifidobacterium animalis subsp. lactis CECT 8145]|nr:hypothetical protein M8PIadj_0328 [Bifidobacterium animalis]CDL72061.1 hypothetical protein BN931_1284 [Bifidobacterium animalis subsp. lactis CECT 8145]